MSRKLGDYCLKCFADLPSGAGAAGESKECLQCGFRIWARDRQRFWSLHPRHVLIQKVAQRALALFMVAWFVLTYFGILRFEFPANTLGSARGASWYILVPLGFAAALYEQAGHITRHPRVNWLLVWSIFLAGMIGWSLYAGSPVAAVGFLALGAVAWFVRSRFLAWKQSWIDGDRRPTSPSFAG